MISILNSPSAGKTEAVMEGSDREGAVGADLENSEREAGILGSYLFTENSLKIIENFTEKGVAVVTLTKP